MGIQGTGEIPHPVLSVSDRLSTEKCGPVVTNLHTKQMWGAGSTLGPDTKLCHLISLGYLIDQMCAMKLLGKGHSPGTGQGVRRGESGGSAV